MAKKTMLRPTVAESIEKLEKMRPTKTGLHELFYGMSALLMTDLREMAELESVTPDVIVEAKR